MKWREFWQRLLSPQTARFILALLALILSASALFYLMSEKVEPAVQDATIFALGLMFGLAKDAFAYYFGSTARGDERPIETEIVNTPENPAQTHDVGDDR